MKAAARPATHEGAAPDDVEIQYLPGAEPEQRTLKVVSAVDFMAMQFPPRKPIIDPILCSQGLALLYGPRGVGKTYLGLGLAVACAAGTKFLRWTVPDPLGVMFIDGEMPAPLLQERIEQTLQTLACDTVAPFKIVTPDLQDTTGPNLLNILDQGLICEQLEDVEVVILDNLSTLCSGARENHADDWQAVQDFVLRLRRLGKTVILVHHAGKGGQQRGTSRREDVLDTVISLRRPAGYVPQDGARFEVHYEKARGFYGPDADPFLAELDTLPDGTSRWSVLDLVESRTQQVARLVNDQGLNVMEIASELGIHKSNASRALKKAKEEGLIDE